MPDWPSIFLKQIQIMKYRYPVLFTPVRIADLCFVNLLEIFSFYFHGNGQPFDTVSGLYLLSVAPVPSRQLHVVIQ